jgi:hypothetical protein
MVQESRKMILDKSLLRLRGQTREDLGESSTQENGTQIFKKEDQPSLYADH